MDIKNKKNNIDWERIECEYRAGIKTLRQISAEHDISHVSIAKRAKKEGWPKDLTARIKAKADDLVNKGLVNNPTNKLTENEIVEANAKNVAAIDLEHHYGCARSRATFNRLHEEFDKQSSDNDPLEKRVATFQRLVSTQETLYSMERRIVKLDTVTTNSSIEDILQRI